MANWSDRGGAGPQAIDVFRAWHEDREARERGEIREIRDPRLDDVRSLDAASIAELGERYGTERVAGEIAARAAVQLQSVRLVVPRDGHLHRVEDAPELTEADKRYAHSRALGQHIHYFHNADDNVRAMLVDVLGEDRAREVKLSDAAIRRIAETPKHARRKALAKELETMETTDETQD